MAKNPIQIQDYISPIESFRKEVFKEGTNSSKVKPFIFKTFQTEKQRIVLNFVNIGYLFNGKNKNRTIIR